MKYFALFMLSIALLKDSKGNEAIVAFNSGQLDIAKKIFESQVQRSELENQSLIFLSRIAIQENKLDDAERYLNKALKIEPNDANEFYWLGVMSGQKAANASIFSAGSYAADTREYFKKAIELNPSHIGAYKGLANFYIQAPSIIGGDKKKAFQVIKSIKELSKLEGDLIELSLLITSKDIDKSLKKAKFISKFHSDSARALYSAGFTLQSHKHYIESASLFVQASQIKSDDADERNAGYKALYQIGRTALFSGNNLEEGIKAFQQYLEIDPPKDAPSKQWAKFRLASLLEKRGDKKTALDILADLEKEKITSGDLRKQVAKAIEKHQI